MPSRLEVKLPPDFHLQMESAKATYHRFGQYSRALDQLRLRLENRAVEKAELERMCSETTKDDIRRNRNNAAERLGFLGRVIHGTNPRAWLKELRQRVGEGIDFATPFGE